MSAFGFDAPAEPEIEHVEHVAEPEVPIEPAADLGRQLAMQAAEAEFRAACDRHGFQPTPELKAAILANAKIRVDPTTGRPALVPTLPGRDTAALSLDRSRHFATVDEALRQVRSSDCADMLVPVERQHVATGSTATMPTDSFGKPLRGAELLAYARRESASAPLPRYQPSTPYDRMSPTERLAHARTIDPNRGGQRPKRERGNR